MAYAAADGLVSNDARTFSARERLVVTPTVDPGFLATAVVTGSPEALLGVSVSLKGEGFDILAAEWEAEAIGAGIPARTLGCYVQYPPLARPATGRPLEFAATVLASEMVSRFDALTKVGPLLAPGAAVVIVVGDHLAGASLGAPLDLRDFVEVFAEAVERDYPDVHVIVVDESLGAEQVAALARRTATPPAHWSSYVGLEPGMSYTDWRDEVIAVTS